MRVEGLVSLQSTTGGTPSPLEGAEVRAAIDRNGNGTIGAGESWTTTTAADGSYSLSVPVSGSETVVLRFKAASDGTSPVFRTLRATDSTHVVANATLRELLTLSCDASGCTTTGGALALSGLPAGTTGTARAFNPATETEAFPGNFDDSDGNLLVSGVFATFEMKDASGGALTTLATPAAVRIRMPRDTWGAIVDIAPATTAQIDVPLYYFDEVAGTWVRDGEGWLEDAGGALVPASELGNLHSGAYAGDVYVAGNVSHFSTWNVDWPISSHGCVTGRIVDTSSKPVEGATVSVRGVSYTGTSTPVTVGADGTFCVEAMRSEGVGEDVDGDGVTGETTTVGIRVVSAGKVYAIGERTMATAAGTCGGAGCLDLGDLVLSDANLLTAGLCTVNGVVRDRAGAAVAGAVVYAWDQGIPDVLWETLCMPNPYTFACTIAGSSAADGSFSVTSPMLEGVTLWGMASISAPPIADTLYGERWISGCPPADPPVTLTLDQGYRIVTPTLDLAGSVISWTPSGYEVVWIGVYTGGVYKWFVSADGTGFAGPVTYGTTPAGATQLFPYDGVTPPAALASGDLIEILLSGTTAEGLPYWGSATLTVP